MSISDLFSRLKNSTSPSAIEHAVLVDAVEKMNCHLVDVREPGEFAAGHIPTASNHPLSQFDPARLPKDRPVVLVCQAGSRSARALKAAHAAGRTDVVHYESGTVGWTGRGGKLAF